jgi:hypothetical protein
MAIATSNFTILGYGNYTDVGTASEAKPTKLQELPMTGESLGYQTQSISSQNINSSRQILDTVQTGYDVSGGIQIEMAPKIYDKFLSAALWANWQAAPVNEVDEDITITAATRTIVTTSDLFAATPTTARICPGQFFRISKSTNSTVTDATVGYYQVASVTNATTAIVKAVDGASPFAADVSGLADIKASMIRAPKDGSSGQMVRQCFLLEKLQSDLATPLYTYFSKAYVNTLSLNAQSASLLTGSIDFMGELSGMSDESFCGDDVYSAADPFNGFNAVSHVKSIIVNGIDFMGGGTDALFVQGFDFQITNNLRGAKAIGHLGNVDTLAGQLGITGNMNVFFENSKMYDLFTSQEEFPLSFTLEDENGDGYVFSFPRVTISSDSMSAGGNDQDLIENMQWTAMFDKTLLTSMQIDRIYGTY